MIHSLEWKLNKNYNVYILWYKDCRFTLFVHNSAHDLNLVFSAYNSLTANQETIVELLAFFKSAFPEDEKTEKKKKDKAKPKTQSSSSITGEPSVLEVSHNILLFASTYPQVLLFHLF